MLTLFCTQNVTFLSELTKFGVVPAHLILHIFKVFVDDFSSVNIDNTAMLLEKCGRYLIRADETKEKMVSLVQSPFRSLLTRFTEVISIGGTDATEAKRSASRPATVTGVGECLLSRNPSPTINPVVLLMASTVQSSRPWAAANQGTPSDGAVYPPSVVRCAVEEDH